MDVDPFALPGIHEHMIRSPPPTTWPKSPNCRVFHFPNGDDETLRVEVNVSQSKSIFRIMYYFFLNFKTKEKSKSETKSKYSSWELPDSSPSKSLSRFHMQDKFSLLTPSALRSSAEDSVRLMSDD